MGVGVMLTNSKDGVILCLSLSLLIVFVSKVGIIGDISLLVVSDIVELTAL